METLKNYLESMFMNLPNTPEVRRAKDELWQMMEDKYSELKEEGKSENEIVGTIISEFGNLNEIADELGIRSILCPQDYSKPLQNESNTGDNTQIPPVSRRMITIEEAKDYLKDSASSALCIALGVMLCILSVVGPITVDALGMKEAFGAVSLFCLIAVAVAIFVINGVRMTKWSYLKEQSCALDFATSSMVNERREHYRGTYTVLLTLGIMFCIICVIPVIILDEINVIPGIAHPEDLGAIAMFVMIAVGVFMIVLSACTLGGFKHLLSLNDASTMAGNYDMEHQKGYKSPVAETIMSVYWPTITCIYLCWSFLTFDWWITWIIWPVASIISGVINGIWKK